MCCDVPNMFCMPGQSPAPDVAVMRLSRGAILTQLICFARELLASLRCSASLTRLRRIAHWMGVAMALSFHNGQGAWDPKPAPRPRSKAAKDLDLESYLESETYEEYESYAEYDRVGPGPGRDTSKRYLKRPFGEVVALICKGLGMTPDWETWSAEPWAQEEIRTRAPTSPYADWPTAEQTGRRAKEAWLDPGGAPPADGARPPPAQGASP